MWKTLSPFWGEEYEVQLQPGFHSISIYVMDEDALRCAGNSFPAFGSLHAQPRWGHQRIHQTWPCCPGLWDTDG